MKDNIIQMDDSETESSVGRRQITSLVFSASSVQELHDVVEEAHSKTFLQKLSSFWLNSGPNVVILIFLIFCNIGLIADRLYHYGWGGGTPYTEAIGWGLPIARAMAAGIRLNASMLLLSMLRNFFSWLRGTCVGSVIPFDSYIKFHKVLALVTCILATIHTVAHTVNVDKISGHTQNGGIGLERLMVLKVVSGPEPTTPRLFLFATIPGLSGVVVVLTMIMMYTTSIEATRRPMYDVFWLIHNIGIFTFFGALCVHGLAMLISPPRFYIWFVGPGFLYLIERSLRLVRGIKTQRILKMIQHPSNVMEIQIEKPADFLYKSGQYLYLSCPHIATAEWHPFTISSSPDEEFVSVHIRVCGDWTGKLQNFLNPHKARGEVIDNTAHMYDHLFELRLDGPYGAAAEEIFNFSSIMLLATGIGVTPFASILKSIRFYSRAYNNNSARDQFLEGKKGSPNITSVEFFWMNRDHYSFEWFITLLQELEATCPFLKIHLFLTGVLKVDQVKKFAKDYSGPRKDPLTGLSSHTHFRRPDFDKVFAQRIPMYNRKTVGVFVCGPNAFTSSVKKECTRYSSPTVRFVFHKENF